MPIETKALLHEAINDVIDRYTLINVTKPSNPGMSDFWDAIEAYVAFCSEEAMQMHDANRISQS